MRALASMLKFKIKFNYREWRNIVTHEQIEGESVSPMNFPSFMRESAESWRHLNENRNGGKSHAEI